MILDYKLKQHIIVIISLVINQILFLGDLNPMKDISLEVTIIFKIASIYDIKTSFYHGFRHKSCLLTN